MYDSDSDQYAQLQEILDEILGGRTEGHKCPFCGTGTLEVPLLDEGKVRLECGGCRRFFEGTFR